MLSERLALPEVVKFTPETHIDPRGLFFESFNAREFEAVVGAGYHFVQDNHSHSVRGVLRGLHYQLPPMAQGKLVRAVVGEIHDVAVDLRRSSPRYGQWVAVRLSADNRCQLWIPPGFAHGFLVISAQAEVIYKTTAYYAPEAERCLAWNDPALAIDWPGTASPLLSPRDTRGVWLADAEVFD